MLRVSTEGAKQFTPEQQAAIVKYAAGLLLGWNSHHVDHVISPDIGDGFDDQETFELFGYDEESTEDQLLWEAHGEVVSVLDNFIEDIAKLAGFDTKEEAEAAIGSTETVYGKYPVMKSNHQHG
jgi:hypothetical protein